MGCASSCLFGNSEQVSSLDASELKVRAGMSQEFYDQILAEFMALDVNDDKQLSRIEFEKLSSLPGSCGDQAPLFDTVDLDHNQIVSFDEFLEHMAKHMPWLVAGISKESYDGIVSQFVTLDQNGDHQLSRQEFENVAGLPGHLGMQASDITHLFSTVDLDKSQAISLNEFVIYMSNRKDTIPLPVQVDPQKQRLQKNMQSLGFELSTTDGGRRGVDGDGNCQFYSLSWGLHRTTSKHAEVRSKVIEYLRGPGCADFSVFYAPTHPSQPASFHGYLDSMAKDRTWGDQLTLQAAANVFNMKVFVLTADQFNAQARPILVLKPQQDCVAAAMCVWISFAALHYSPIEPTSRTPRDLVA
mmetsp:Transcript_46682/g.105799  ORF Transcript_46682/g.105799 Transcript_46682/m.105799 type:complete len:357 (-) Transcript_46682:32-1102(-)